MPPAPRPGEDRTAPAPGPPPAATGARAAGEASVACVPWRAEPVHEVLFEDGAVTLYDAAAAAAAADADVVFHSHALDTVYVMLSAATAVNEVPGGGRTPFATVPGGVLVYDLAGKPPLVHRVRDHARPLAFVGVEVALPRLPSAARRLGVLPCVAAPLEPAAPFATAGRVALAPGAPTPLLRERGPGFLPARTFVVAIDNASRVSDLVVSAPPSARARRVASERLGFRFEVLLLSYSAPGVFEIDAGCVLLNKGGQTWHGVVIDIWGKWAAPGAAARGEE